MGVSFTSAPYRGEQEVWTPYMYLVHKIQSGSWLALVGKSSLTVVYVYNMNDCNRHVFVNVHMLCVCVCVYKSTGGIGSTGMCEWSTYLHSY